MQEHILDTLGLSDKVAEVLAETTRECIKEGAKELGKEYTKELVKSAAGNVVSPLAKDLAQAIGGELTKAVAGVVVGPLIGILFRVVDDTKLRINKILSEPEITAVREAETFLKLKSESPVDAALIEEKFAAVSDAFDRAYTFAASERDANARRLWIRMMQGIIARHRGGKAVARHYFQESFAILRESYADLPTRTREIAESLKRRREAIEKEIKTPPPKARPFTSAYPMNAIGREMQMEMNLQIAEGEEDRRRLKLHQERIDGLRREVEAERKALDKLQNLENFIQVVQELSS